MFSFSPWVINTFRERVLADQVGCIMVTWKSYLDVDLNEILIPCAPGRLTLPVIYQRICLAREMARHSTTATYYWCQLSGSLDCCSKSNYADGEHLFLLQEPSWLNQTKGPLNICSMEDSQAVSKGEKDFLSRTGPWVQPQKLRKTFWAFCSWGDYWMKHRTVLHLKTIKSGSLELATSKWRPLLFPYRHIPRSTLAWFFAYSSSTFLVQL